MPGSPNPDEAAAIAAALQRFLAETAVPAGAEGPKISPWQRAALLEGVGKRVTIEDLEGEGGGRWPS